MPFCAPEQVFRLCGRRRRRSQACTHRVTYASATPSEVASSIISAASRNCLAFSQPTGTNGGGAGLVGHHRPPSELPLQPGPLAVDGQALGEDGCEEGLPPTRPQLSRRELDGANVVACPGRHVGRQVGHLRLPILLGCLVGADEQQIDVARRASRAPGHRAEHGGIHRREAPGPDPVLDPGEQRCSELRQFEDRAGRQMVPVEAVEVRISGPLRGDDALLDQPGQGFADPVLRESTQHPVQLPGREGGLGLGEDSQEVTFQGGRNHGERSSCIHDPLGFPLKTSGLDHTSYSPTIVERSSS